MGVGGFGVGVGEHLRDDQPAPILLTLQGAQREVVTVQLSAADHALRLDLQMRADQHNDGSHYPETGLRRTGEFTTVEVLVVEQAAQILHDVIAPALDGAKGVDQSASSEYTARMGSALRSSNAFSNVSSVLPIAS